MAVKIRCPNMNHGRSNVSVSYCPDCGEALATGKRVACNEEMHATRRRNKSTFCVDCGKRLTPIPSKR